MWSLLCDEEQVEEEETRLRLRRRGEGVEVMIVDLALNVVVDANQLTPALARPLMPT